MKKKMMSLGLAAAMTASLLAGAATVQAEESAALNVALTNPFTGASAINIANPFRFAALSQVYETMLSLNNGEYENVLLESYEQSEPGIWSLTLYEGITDSEGNAFTADDLKWAMNAQKDAGSDLGRYYEKDCVEVVDDTHCKLNLGTDSEGTFYMIAAQMLLCTQEAYDNSSDQLATMPIGTGPYVCTEYVEGSSLSLEKRADYWKTDSIPRASTANYDVINVSFVPEATQMAIAIESGNTDLACWVDMSISEDADNAEGMTTYYTTNGTYNGISFNMNGRAISEDKALREAIAMAIDPLGLAAAVYRGHAEEMPGYGMATALDYDESWTKPYSYDEAAAVAKLEESNYNGEEIVLLANNVGEDSQIAELIQAYLAAVGINVVFDYVDPATQEARIAEGEWDLCLVGGAGVLDMSLFWGNLYRLQETGMSKYFHNDPALYEIFDPYIAVGGQTDEARQALYEYESSNITWYPLFNKQVLYVFEDSAEGLVLNDAYMALPYIGTLQ